MILRGLFGGGGGGGERAEPAALPVVRNVTIGRTVIVDPLAWRRLGSETKFALARDTLDITAQGQIRLDDGSYVHRFYTDDELMLQAVSHAADGSDADDFTLFQPWTSRYPAHAADRRQFVDRLRRASFQEPGLPRFERFWYPDDLSDQEPVCLWESVYHERTGRPVRRIYQCCMLYARALGEDGTELLLALEMEPEGGDVTHELMVGLPLTPGEFSA